MQELISLEVISGILITHFIADFILQSDNVAKNKSKSNIVLLQHVLIYGLPFIIIVSPLYAIVNLLLHFVTDYFTSRLASKLWSEGRVHYFFVVIGFDQLIHALTLIWTYQILIN